MGTGNRLIVISEEKRAAREAAQRGKAAKAGRDGVEFTPLPRVVQTSPGWHRAEIASRALLMDIASSGPNGKLTASAKYLKQFGWHSADTINRCIKDLLASGLLVLTRRGARPNVAAWYAVTWMKLFHTKGLDIDPTTFKRGLYLNPEKPPPVVDRARTAKATKARRLSVKAAAAGFENWPKVDEAQGMAPAVDGDI